MDDNTTSNTNQNPPLENNNISANQTSPGKKNIFQKIIDIFPWILLIFSSLLLLSKYFIPIKFNFLIISETATTLIIFSGLIIIIKQVAYKNIFQKIINLPSWIYGLISIILLISFIILSVSPLEPLLQVFAIFGIFIWLLPVCGIIRGIVEIKSSKIKSGILGILLSSIILGLLILGVTIGQMAAH